MGDGVITTGRNSAPQRESRVDWVQSGEVKLRVATWRAVPAVERGTVIIFQGRAEFVEKYGETVGELLDRGLAVVAFDWRGQGLSDRLLTNRRSGHVGDYAEFMADAAAVLAHAGSLDLPRPWILLGHSMGGHMALRWAHAHADSVAAVVLTAPMIDFIHPPLPRWLVLALASAMRTLGLGGRYAPGQGDVVVQTGRFEGNPLTRSRERFDRFRAALRDDPRLGLGGVTVGWVWASLRSIAALQRPGVPEAIRTPVLLALACADRVVDNEAIRRIARRMPGGELLELPGAEHEILIELDETRAAFWAAFDRFVATVLARS